MAVHTTVKVKTLRGFTLMCVPTSAVLADGLTVQEYNAVLNHNLKMETCGNYSPVYFDTGVVW
jgi:hypothetical protein